MSEIVKSSVRCCRMGLVSLHLNSRFTSKLQAFLPLRPPSILRCRRIVKHFYDKHFYGGACIPAAVQCRLLLRVLGDEFEAGRCNFTMASLDALEALQAYSAADLSAFPSLAEPRKLHPSVKLMLEVRCCSWGLKVGLVSWLPASMF